MSQRSREIVGIGGVWATMPTKRIRPPFPVLRLFQLPTEEETGGQLAYQFELGIALKANTLGYGKYQLAAEELVTLHETDPGPGLVAVRIPTRVEQAGLHPATTGALGELASSLSLGGWNADLLHNMGGSDRFNLLASIVPEGGINVPGVEGEVPAAHIITAGLRLALVETVELWDVASRLGQIPPQ